QARTHNNLSSNSNRQKFFGSFFQKRTASFLTAPPPLLQFPAAPPAAPTSAHKFHPAPATPGAYRVRQSFRPPAPVFRPHPPRCSACVQSPAWFVAHSPP